MNRNFLRIERPEGHVNAGICLPASKSISNRLLILRFLSGSDAEIGNLSDSGDTLTMLSCLQQVREAKNDGSIVEVDAGDAGTVMRFLTAVLAVTEGEWLLSGSERMKQRPVKPLVDALLSLGAGIEYLEKNGYPPLHISGRELNGGEVTIQSGESSQYISAIIMIAPLLRDGMLIELLGTPVSAPYLDMTLQLLEKCGVTYKLGIRQIDIPANKYIFKNFTVEPDWSAASYWYSICALDSDSQITLKGMGTESLQGDRLVADLYRGFGVQTEFTSEGARLQKTMPHKHGLRFNFMHFPDLAQTVAVTAAGLGIPASLTGLENLRIKETDRIAAVAIELQKAGCEIREEKSSLEILQAPLTIPAGLMINTYNDHRMAMAFAPLAMKAGSILIEDPDVINKSYPGLWQDLKYCGFKL